MFQMAAVASLRAIDNLLCTKCMCTSITEEWIVNQLGLTIITDSEENGGIRIMRGNTRLMMGFCYEERKCIRKSQLIDLAFRGEMCLTQFVYEAAERGVFTTVEG